MPPLDPVFDSIWDLLFALTETPVDPTKDLFGELVNLLALPPAAQ